MALAPGTRFGPYEINGPIGAGGMGEVYRATDTVLKRAVAIKVLPDSFSSDADRLARFQREAEVLASLNHPNIAQILGLENAGGTTALVLELVEGPTLADRIEQGPLPADEALNIAMQIADALEAAHARQIVHRDLKPANIKLRPDGTVKVLDFGIAKPLDAQTGVGGEPAPQLTTPAMTQAGIVLGTAAYMSPEQARGKPIDRRTDIWAFGCVLYEMLTGQPAFVGEDVALTLARVLAHGTDMNSLPATISPAVRHTISLCLTKDPKKRIADIADVRLALQGVFETPIEAAAREGGGGKRARGWGLAAVAALVAAGLAGLGVWSLAPRATGSAPTTRFIVRTLGDVPLTTRLPLTLSPDGRELVYSAGRQPDTQLFHQSLAGFEPSAIDGSLGGENPFFSPRGDTIGFYSPRVGQLQRLALTGGSASRLVDNGGNSGASWDEDGTLVFSPAWGKPLRIIRAGESEANDLTRLDPDARQQSHLNPQILPGNRGVLFTIWSGAPTWDESELAVADLETGRYTVVLRGGASGRYAKSGHLVFWRGNALLAVPFDLDTLTVHGEPVRVVPDVRLVQGSGAAHFAISDTGTLAYIQGKEDVFSESFIVDRNGQRSIKLDESVRAGTPVFSPDGRQLALTLYRGGVFAIGVFDLDRGQLTPITLTQDNAFPSWTSNGDRIAFVSNRDGEYSLYTMRADGSGSPEPIFAEAQGYSEMRIAWSRDGRYLAYEKRGANGLDIWMQERVEDAQPRPLIATVAAETALAFSPDGRQIVYQSDESGRNEIYVRPFPDVDARRELISRSGGSRPVWSSDGSEIFYVSEAGLMTVPVVSNDDGVLRFGQPALVFEMSGISNFDVSPDGQTFAIQRATIETLAREIHVVTNWFDELERLVPTH